MATELQAMSVLPGSVDTAMLKGGGFKAEMSASDVAGLVVVRGARRAGRQ